MYYSILALAFAAAGGTVHGVAAPAPLPVVAINAEKADGFRNLAECRRTIGVGRVATGRPGNAGTLINRAHGNRSRCEMVGGEPSIVVYPRGT